MEEIIEIIDSRPALISPTLASGSAIDPPPLQLINSSIDNSIPFFSQKTYSVVSVGQKKLRTAMKSLLVALSEPANHKDMGVAVSPSRAQKLQKSDTGHAMTLQDDAFQRGESF